MEIWTMDLGEVVVIVNISRTENYKSSEHFQSDK